MKYLDVLYTLRRGNTFFKSQKHMNNAFVGVLLHSPIGGELRPKT